MNRNPELALFPKNLQDSAFGFAFAKGDPRRDEWQTAFDAIPEAETRSAWDKWTGADESVKVLPEQDWPGENGTVRVAACDTLEPVDFVEYYPAAIVLIVRGIRAGNEAQNVVPELAEYEHARAAVQTGTISGDITQAVLPDIKLEYYNSQTDCLTALQTGKVDLWAIDEPIARYLLMGNDDLQIIGNLDSSSVAAVFPKTDAGQALCAQYSAFVDGLWADGTMKI